MVGFPATALFAALAGAALSVSAAAADTIRIGLSVSATGPAASLGIPQRNTVSILPKEVAGQSMEYFVLDDATLPQESVTWLVPPVANPRTTSGAVPLLVTVTDCGALTVP